MKHLLPKLSLVACLATTAIPAMMAQVQNGTITGTITDSTGAIIPDAAVTVTSKSTGLVLHGKTNSAGLYTFPQLNLGAYTVTIEKSGFQKAVTNLELTVGQTAEVSLSLTVGNEGETVNVQADTLGTLDTQNSNLDYTVQSKQVDSLPLNGRNPYGLAVLAPGIAPGANFGVGVTVARGAVVAAATNNFQSSGGIGGSNEVLLDGVSIVVCCQGQPAVTPSVEFVNQFKVVSSSAPAQYGRTSGAVLNIVSKSGTNSLHGSVYEFLRNDKLDAANYFTKRSGVYPYPGHADYRPPHRSNQYGVLVNGPVYIPKVYNGKDRTFFTFNYEAIRNLVAAVGTSTVPTALMRQGIFTEGTSPIYDPYSSNSATQSRTPIAAATCNGTTYAAGYCIPTSTWNPVAAKYLQFMPAPNIAGAAVNTPNYSYVSNQISRDDQYNFRVDQNVGAAHRLFVRGTRSYNTYTNNDNMNSPTGPGGWVQTLKAYLFALGDVYTVTPNTVVQLSYGFARQTNQQLGNNFFKYNAGDYGYSSNLLSQQQVAGIPVATFSTAPQIGFSAGFNSWAHYTHSLNGTVLWTHGTHSITAGYQGRLIMEMQQGLGNPNGTLGFSTGFTSQLPNGSVAGTQTQFASWAAFLLGTPTTGSIQRQLTQAFNQFVHGMFVQDDWRVTPNLTLNVGLRYDIETGFKERRNNWADFDPNIANPLNVKGGALFMGSGNNPSRLWATSYKEWGPRFGLSYSATPTLVFRGGYGLLYLPTSNRGYSNPNIGFSQSTSLPTTATGYTPAATSQNPFINGVLLPAGATAGSGVSNGTTSSGLQYNNPVSYQQQWNFGMEKGLGNTFTLQLNYVGGHGVHLPVNIRYNDLQPKYFLPVGTAPADQGPLTGQVTNPFYGAPNVAAGVLRNPTVQQIQLNAAFPQYTSGAISTMQNGSANVSYQDIGSTTYNAMQATIGIHRPNGVFGSVSYVWSKLLGNVSDLTNGFLNTNGNPGIQNFYAMQYEHSTLATDLRHRIVGTANYALPVGRGKRFGGNMPGWANQIVGGWEVNTIIQVSSGYPIAMTVTGTPAFAGTRPMIVQGKNPLTGGSTKSHIVNLGSSSANTPYINPDAVALPKSFQLGTVPRSWSAVRGPLNFSDDASIIKRFPIHDQIAAQFRVEAFNVLNKVQFASPAAQAGAASTAFGYITSQANLPRNVQVALKVTF